MRLVFAFLYISIISIAQKAPDEMKYFDITVNYEDYTVKTQMLKDGEKIKTDNELAYLWYKANKIIETKGGYDGRLLHGYYKTFYLNNQLKEQGQIHYGLKNKEWKYWYSNGLLREVITWKNGRKNGIYMMYNDQGKLMATGNFKNDLLDGKFSTYDSYGNVSDTKKYKNGTEVLPKIKKHKAPKGKKLKEEKKDNNESTNKGEKKTFGQKLKKIFKKKDTSTSPVTSKESKKNISTIS